MFIVSYHVKIKVEGTFDELLTVVLNTQSLKKK